MLLVLVLDFVLVPALDFVLVPALDFVFVLGRVLVFGFVLVLDIDAYCPYIALVVVFVVLQVIVGGTTFLPPAGFLQGLDGLA